MFYDGWRWGWSCNGCLVRSSSVLSRECVAGGVEVGSRDLSPFAITMLWNLYAWTRGHDLVSCPVCCVLCVQQSGPGATAETWLEVIHASRGGKREVQDKQSLTWADFIDPGPAGIWFHYAKGSGIFYRSGRTLVSPAKNAALASLFAEASRTAAVAERWPPAGFVESKLVDSSYKARNLAWLTEQMHLTSRGMRNCTQAGLRGFRTPYIVHDDWDSVMVWLARQLAYDTIFLTASLCCTPDVTNQCGVAELVDVRIPKTVLSDGQLSMPKPAMGSFLRKPMDTLPMSAYTSKSTDLSRSWAKGLYASHTLTPRDPWDVAKSNRSQACRFLQEIRGWLSCDGHLPSMLIADDSTIAGSLIRNLAWPSIDPIAPYVHSL